MLHVPTSLDVPPASQQPGLQIIKNWAVSAFCLSFLTLVFTFNASAQTLYGLSNGIGSPSSNNQIYRIDPATGTISNAHAVTLAGYTVESANALAARPSSSTLYAVIGTLDAVNGRKRRLVTIDPNTGVATEIGPLSQNIAGLAFRPDNTLWAVSGDGASTPETLFTVDTATAALTQQFTLGNGEDGEAIAFHPQTGVLYHASGPAKFPQDPGEELAFFESVNVDTQGVTVIASNVSDGEVFGMSYSISLGQMYLSDWNSNLYTVNLSTGARTPIGVINSPVINRGLAFVVITTSAPASISGQLVGWNGAPVNNSSVTARGQNGAVYTAATDKRGKFRLTGLPTGETYMISVKSNRYKFTPSMITLTEDVADLTIKANR